MGISVKLTRDEISVYFHLSEDFLKDFPFFSELLNRIHAVENHKWTRINTNKGVPGAVLRTGRRVTVE